MIGKNSSLYKYCRILRYAFRHWLRLGIIFALTMASSLLAMLQPWPLKIVVDYAVGEKNLPDLIISGFATVSIGTSAANLIVLAAIASVAVFALISVVDFALTLTWGRVGQNMLYELATDIFRQLQRLSLVYHSRSTIGDSLNRITGDTWCVYQLASSFLVAPAQNVLTLLAVGGVAWTLDATLAIMVVFGVPVMATSSFLFSRWIKDNARKDSEWKSSQLALVQQTLAAIPLVKAFVSESRNRLRFLQLADDAVNITRRSVKLRQSLTLINGMAAALVTASVLFIGGQQVLTEAMTLGTLLVFLSYAQTINGATRGLLNAYVELRTVEARIERLLEVLDSEESVVDAQNAVSLLAVASGERGQLRFENVTFGYVPGRAVLRNINLDVRPGESIAIVGHTGAGKSTLVSLIPRFFDPCKGRVTLDGVDLRHIRLSILRANIALVLQEPFLLPLSVADNIAYGRPGAGPGEIVAAAITANADSFIRQLPEGYETLLAEGGVTLSGGQKQRIAIARAILMDAPVLVLDEPTSALDAKTEALVMEAIHRLMSNRTSLIIAHRLSTIRQADRIAVIENGSIVEVGTHSELLAAAGRYQELHLLQCSSTPQRQQA